MTTAPPQTAVTTSAFAPQYRAVTLGMVTLIALTAFEALAVTTVMPGVVDALGGLNLYAMAFAAPVASGVVGMVAAGGWADRRGPARPLLWGVVLFSAGLVIAGTADAMETVVAGRVVQGLGAGLITVSLYVVVARIYPSAVQPRVFAAFAAAWVLPAVVGPAVAGLVADHIGWRWVFLAVPVLAVPAVASLRPALALVSGSREPAPDVVVGPDWGRLGRATGAGAGALVLHWGGQQSGGVAVGGVGAGLVLLAVTVPALLPRGTLSVRRGLPSVIVLRGLVGAAFFGAEVYLPLLLVTERGLTKAQAGVALTVAAVLWSAGSWLRGRSGDRWSDATILRTGAFLMTVGIGAAALGVTDAPVALVLAAWGLAGLGMGLVYPTLSLLTLRLSPALEQGANSSALQVNESLTIAVVLAASGPVFAGLVERDPTAAFLACFGLAAALGLAALVLAGRVRVRS